MGALDYFIRLFFERKIAPSTRIINRDGNPKITLNTRAIIEHTSPKTITIITRGSAKAPIINAMIPIIKPINKIANSVNMFIPHFFKLDH